MANFVYPEYSNNIYSLSNSILQTFGIDTNKPSIYLNVPSKKKVCLIVLDGLGLDMLSHYENGAEVELRKMTTVFPSTTATVLASLLLNMSPGEHGILGYKTFYKRAAGIIKPLEFTYAAIPRPGALGPIGEARDFFPFMNLFTKLYRKRRVKSTVITPIEISHSEYSELIISGATNVIGYHNIWDSFEMLENELRVGKSRFVYMYIPYIDSLAHNYTKNDNSVRNATRFIYNGIKEIFGRNSNRVFGMVTSDHGHSSVSNTVELEEDYALMDKLEIPPYGDSRALMLRTRNDIRQDLSKYNLRVFSKDESLKLFGDVNENTYKVLPDFVAVPADNTAYSYDYDLRDKKNNKRTVHLKSHHGGLSKEEMEIPLVIFDS